MNTFTKLRIGTIELPNRLVMAPVKTGYGTSKGESTYRHEAYYRRRAEGGVGAIVVEPLYIDPLGKEHPKQLGISDYEHLEGLTLLVAAIHEGGALAIAHLNHGGRAVNPKVSGSTPEAPSEVQCQLTGVTPIAMNEQRIRQVVKEFAGSAQRAAEAGFDAVEIQFGLGYLIAQFLSAHTNRRRDGYGGSLENRRRFAAEVLAAIGEENGTSVPVIARISASEQVQGGLEIADAIALARFLQEQGVSALHVVSGSICDSPPWYYQHMRLPLGKNLEWAALIKKEVELPVIVAGRLGKPEDIRRALDDGVVDAIALGRPLVADPDLPSKMKENRDEEVIQCGACLQGCLAKVRSGEGLGCIINPEVGHEAEQFRRPEKSKTVVVVGGGPGGMQAGLTASQRGHKVILFDKGELGGQFNLSYLPPGKAMMQRALVSFVNKVKHSEIDLRLSREVTAQEISAENPDVVVIATGATPIIPAIAGLDNPMSGQDVLTGARKVGKRVLVIGGGMVGLETAEFLAVNGQEVSIVELLDDVGRDMLPVTKKLTLKGLSDTGISILTSTEVSRFEGKEAFVINEGRERSLGVFDSVVVSVGTRPVNDLESLLQGQAIEVKVIGDAKQPRQIYDAVKEGYEVAREI